MGKRNALDRIRRQPAAPQVLNTLLDNDSQTTQIGLFSTQLATTRQQSQRILEKCNELGIRDSALLQALRNLREIIESQGHAAGCLESLLVSVYARQEYAQNINFPLSHTERTTSDVEAQKPTNFHLTPRTRKDIPASPFRLASRVSSEAKTEYFVNSVDFEKQNQCHKSIKPTSAIPYQIEMGTSSDRALLQCPAVTSLPTVQGNLDRIAYPVGQLQCIDPIYNSNVHNIIDIRSSGAPPLAHTTIDPCWTRQPLVLLVENDETCRRIGGILLRSLQCRIDSASDGLEAVSKFHAGLRYDLVLMDIIMPNLDGVSATQFVRWIDSTPIIAMTSDVSYEHVAMCFQYGRSHSIRYHLASLTLFRNERRFTEAIYERRLVQDAREASKSYQRTSLAR